MKIDCKNYIVKGVDYIIRCAEISDSKELSEVRLRIDGETEFLDREPGEAFIDEEGFKALINSDIAENKNLFLVAEVNGKIAGFSRCQGNELKRFSHKVELGICVLMEFWGFGIGRNLLSRSIEWAENTGIKKICLSVLETNEKAIGLYKSLGFEEEGVLINDRILSDGKFYNTIVMGRNSLTP